MGKTPESYLNCRRPPLLDALHMENKETDEEAAESLRKKGYFTPKPRPWQLGSNNRGMGREDWAVLDRFGDLVIKTEDRETAMFIIDAVNAYSS